MGKIIKITTTVLILIILDLVAAEDITYTTPLGSLIGVRRQVLNKTLYEFRNIPYAKPPVGNLRFEKPVRYGPWQGTLDARNYGPSCLQYIDPVSLTLLPNKEVSEDCLQLNIYVPFTLSSASNKSVMVWIHGGGYMSGQAQLYDGSNLAVTGDVIVVTINYRLSGLGFFQARDFKGNYGLWDQIMALQWVKDEIRAYGGSDSITIFGESAGGFSVALLSMMPRNKGLFKRSIMQSGTAISPFTLASLANDVSIAISQTVNCTMSDAYQYEQCIKHADANTITMTSISIIGSGAFELPIGPVIDNELLTENPLDLLSDPNSEAAKFFNSLDIMAGIVNGEASLLIDNLLYSEGVGFNISDSIPWEYLCYVLVPDVIAKLYNNNTKLSSYICNKYWQGATKDERSNSAADLILDLGFHLPAVQTLRYHASSKKRHYHYMFSRKNQYPVFEMAKEAKWFNKAGHATELFFQFPGARLSKEEQSLANTFMTYWTNFAKTGDVNERGLVEWKEYDLNNEFYINLDINITMGRQLFKDRVDFWLTEIPQIINPPRPTTPRATMGPTGSAPCSGHNVMQLLLQTIIFMLTISFLF